MLWVTGVSACTKIPCSTCFSSLRSSTTCFLSYLCWCFCMKRLAPTMTLGYEPSLLNTKGRVTGESMARLCLVNRVFIRTLLHPDWAPAYEWVAVIEGWTQRCRCRSRGSMGPVMECGRLSLLSLKAALNGPAGPCNHGAADSGSV